MQGDKFIGRLKELMAGIDAITFQNSLQFYEYDYIATIIRQKQPKITEAQIENAYAMFLRGYLTVRELQIFGKTRGEIIGNLGNLVENNPHLKAEYLDLVTNLAENYDSSKETTLAEEFGIELEKVEVTLEQRVKQMDARLLRLMLSKSVRNA